MAWALFKTFVFTLIVPGRQGWRFHSALDHPGEWRESIVSPCVVAMDWVCAACRRVLRLSNLCMGFRGQWAGDSGTYRHASKARG
jgi:hypothetical protein